jgi:hypothetical protein
VRRSGARGAAPVRAPVLFFILLSGCAGGPAPRAHSFEPGRSAAGIVFIVHGIWPDGWWVEDLARALRARGLEPLPVEHTTFAWGVVLGYGTDGPAERIASFARKLEVRHRATGCTVPLRYEGVGYSGGTVVLLKAAERGVPLARAWFGGSPIACYSGDLERALADGRIGRLVNYWSIADGVVNPLFGAGALGFRGGPAERIENRAHARPHVVPVFEDREVAAELAAEIAREARGAPAHACFDDARFSRWFMNEKERLRTPTPCRGDP